jgi:NADH-quinone oxidoreductase subunit L
MKAFITTKIGDVAFLIGLLLIFYATAVNGHPTFQYQKLIEDPSWVETLAGMNLFIPAAILIFGGAIGKSAQFPLHEWLPDAMAGPTAVSALIHAATMVKAGVFLVARMGPVFFLASAASATIDASYFFLFVAAIGAFTAFLAASQALVSTELKKVLAYSTVSQIGYMMLALGAAGLAVDFVSGITAGFFHLASHAVFKASLFMAAGWVIHAAGSRFMEDMGGFRKHMRITFISMLIAGAALAGVPPLSGFWSKDSILAVTLTIHDQTLGQLLFVAAGITALMTAFYTFRMLGMIFWGSSKPHAGTHDGGEAHEAPRIMWIPYAALAVGSIALGAVGPFFEEKLHELFAEDILHTLGGVPAASPGLNPLAVSVSLLALGIGGGLGYLGYIRRSLDTASILKSSRVLRSLHGFLENRWYINSIVYILFVNSTLSLAAGLHRRIESAGFDRLSQASAYASLAFSKVSDKFDVYVVDGAVNGLAKVSQLFSRIVRLIQSGITQSYVVAFALGILLLIVIILR